MVAAGAAIVGTETALAPVNQPLPNFRLERESSSPTQTGAEDPTSLGKAGWKDEDPLDWVLRLSNDVPSLPGGTGVQVDTRVKGPQLQSRLPVIIKSREKFNLKRRISPRATMVGAGKPT